MSAAESTMSLHRRKRLLPLMVTLTIATGLLAVVAPRGKAVTPEVVLGRNRVGEFQAVRGANYLSWQQNTRRDPGQYDVYARPIEGGKRFKVNRSGTQGANGGIEDDLLVYQEFTGKGSDLWFFDLDKRRRQAPPRRVNTAKWEYWPSISGDRLLFGRLSNRGVRKIVLFDLRTRSTRILDKIRGARSFLAPGQVNGDWAAWTRCSATRPCDVIRYHIPERDRETIPNPKREQHAASVGPDGTVYFARARKACGSGVRLVSYTPEGVETELWRLPSGDDIGTTRVYSDPNVGTSVYFDHYDCDQAALSDVWQIAEPAPTPTPSPTAGGGGPQPPTGPTGPTGGTGPTGPTGGTGPTGPT